MSRCRQRSIRLRPASWASSPPRFAPHCEQASQEKAVGRTAGAQSIVISDGDQSVTLSGTDFKKTSDTVYEANVDAGQMRNLSFTVNAADDDYIIVNNRSTKNGVAAPNTYSISASKSRTVRVIVPERQAGAHLLLPAYHRLRCCQ